jgi:hypothetical protein
MPSDLEVEAKPGEGEVVSWFCVDIQSKRIKCESAAPAASAAAPHLALAPVKAAPRHKVVPRPELASLDKIK